MKRNKKLLQPLLGLVLVGLTIAIILQYQFADYYNSFHQGKSETRQFLIWGWIMGIALGYILTRGRFGFAGPIKKLVLNGDARQAKWLVMTLMMTSVLGGALLVMQSTFFSSPSGWFGRNMGPVGLGSIVGGLLFGLGMLMAGGCASGTLTDIGEGFVSAIWVMVFFCVGSVIGMAWIKPEFDKVIIMDSDTAYYGDAFGGTSGIWVGILINVVIFGLIMGALQLTEKYRVKRNTFYLVQFNDDEKLSAAVEDGQKYSLFSYRTYYYIFKKRLSWTLTALLLAGWFIAYSVAVNEAPGITSGYTKWGAWVLHLFGYSDIYTTGAFTGMKNALLDGFMKNHDSIRNLGIIIGSLYFMLSSNSFRFDRFKKWGWQGWTYYTIGGIIMGIGARIAGGCNIGAMWSGISNLSAYGWFFTIFLVVGGVGGSYLIKYTKHLC